ncbi:MAG: twin-arginine translocation pathway signal protein [Panacagrimonas sp.]|jgi:lipid-binding SYLF domain-containing protein|nr:lipid-binding SYLF domain-containing protein [Panacagrimonas sp.]MCC2658360.1 twin-arginine translocation pathway signal protein [Panacagrimonas sp.]
MNNLLRRTSHSLVLIVVAIGLSAWSATTSAASTAEELDHEAGQALQKLYKSSPLALSISQKAAGTLVFPNIVRAGLVFGGAYGEGVLRSKSGAPSYYNSISASWGLQAGAQTYGYVVFLMNAKSLAFLDRSDGWELGVGPSVVVVNEGVAKNLTTSTLKDDAYAFIFDQQGLMASLSIEGTKITRIKR